MVKGTQLIKSRYCHQVTLAALWKLRKEAKEETLQLEEDESTWLSEMKAKSATFYYWDLVMQMEVILLIFVRAHREGNFEMYLEALEHFIPFFFALDHTHYSRWASVHLKNMRTLPEAIKYEFITNKNWVIRKTNSRFSCLPIDQCHEQNNKDLKGAGGVIGLTANPKAMERWLVCGPTLTEAISQFKEQVLQAATDEETQKHHGERQAEQILFSRDVQALALTLSELRNPFLCDFSELVTLGSSIMPDSSVIALRKLVTVGKEQHLTFCQERLSNPSKAITAVIPKNNLKIFCHPNRESKEETFDRKSKESETFCFSFWPNVYYIPTQKFKSHPVFLSRDL